MIELNHISKSYNNHSALKNVNLLIKQGDIFGIIGKSGAGKSTLLRCINLLDRPDLGKVMVDGRDMMALSAIELRKARTNIAMIFQQFNLLNSKNVYDNIALPMRIQGMDEHVIKTKIDELLSLVELTHKANAYVAQLSGGQKQRVAIARALSCSPKIVLCDEATSALDPQTTDSILALLKKINSLYNITIVLITHEMHAVKQICNQLAVMDKGAIIEMMPVRDVLKHKQSVARSLLYAELSPKLPDCLASELTSIPNDKPIIRLLFEDEAATAPFISHVSRELTINITILLANIDRFDGVTCGVLIVELRADAQLLEQFIQQCQQYQLTVEILGYVN